MARFKKGQSGNENGRPPGTPNKITADMRQAVLNIVERNYDRLQSDLDAIENPKDRARLIIDLIKLVTPSSASLSMEGDNDITIVFKRMDGNRD